ncbi:hypothetical protein BGX27_001383 [Mortierella sp. AM989]|nr:hypothetical protein BGX27_001383 [Mortierella sp. AM989]
MIVANPIDIPEIRALVATFISRSDAISCSLVCKAWCQDFTARIWYSIQSIDCHLYKGFEKLDPSIISKHGSLIRKVDHISGEDFSALRHPSIKNLSKLYIILNSISRSWIVDLLRQNRNTIKELWLVDCGPDPHMGFLNFADALIPRTYPYMSNLTLLSLSYTRMTRESFSELLSACPQLSRVNLCECVFEQGFIAEPVKNYHVSCLNTSYMQALSSLLSPSILEHFPNLRRLVIKSGKADLLDFDASEIWDDLKKYCPSIDHIDFKSAPGAVVHKFLTTAFSSLSAATFSCSTFTPEVVPRLLFHKDSLKYVRTRAIWDLHDEYSDDRLPCLSLAERNLRPELSWALQVLTMNCQNLEKIILPELETEMDHVERFPWICKNLSHLAIRIDGLDTKESILEVIEIWRKARLARRKGDLSELDTIINSCNSMTIKDRAARHLLQFEKLDTLWLGHKTWRA